MTQATDIADLIARLEAATGPDQNLDLDESIFWIQYPNGAFDMPEIFNVPTHVIPQYTYSIDAALTLVPDGLDWQVETCKGRSAALVRVGPRHYRSGYPDNPATPALAICIAALRAKQEQPS